ncbi:ERVV2 protein, partial [Centropus unirufus]|nr:ERVV2 protein [Centropus unirufus]
TAKEGGVCVLVNTSCCVYISRERKIETDLEEIWKQTKVWHTLTQDDALRGFTNMWEKLTSRLPNLNCLRQLFSTIIGILVLAIIIIILIKRSLWCLQSTGDSYSNWKKHQLSQQLESNKYFEKM